MIHANDIVGLGGVIFILAAYFLLQIEKLSSSDFLYSLLNLIGACAIFISLLYNWNLSAGIIEIFWIIISFYGILKVLKSK